MKLTSTAFENNKRIPNKYTCDGENISPPLAIDDVPENTQSFVLIVDDPDVPAAVRPEKNWDHWIVYNIPAGTRGMGDYPTTKYGGPCPPTQYEPKEHRYFFKLYALDVMFKDLTGTTKKDIENSMKNHVITKAELIGRYSR
jgi:phosphatidylethanolamine-binding protein (PEBP) family uncharacterized protein